MKYAIEPDSRSGRQEGMLDKKASTIKLALMPAVRALLRPLRT